MHTAANDNGYTRAHPRPLRAVAPQPLAISNIARATADGMTAASLRAVADWNERKSYDERRRRARARLKQQAVALRVLADQREVAEQVWEAA